jgi:hypothetical protein
LPAVRRSATSPSRLPRCPDAGTFAGADQGRSFQGRRGKQGAEDPLLCLLSAVCP